MYKIATVCVAGIGTSMIARDIVSTVVKKLGYADSVSVDACELGSAGSLDCDLIITSRDLKDKIPPSFIKPIPVVPVSSIVDESGITAALKPILDEEFG